MANETRVQEAVETQREIQDEIARADENGGEGARKGAVQTGARRYPEPPFPEQHQPKPGSEAELEPAPMWDAPFYKGSEKLKDKVALITGGDSGIGRAVAVLFAREGADVAITHLAEAEDAETTRRAVEAEGQRCLVLKGDLTARETCDRFVTETVEALGRLDILVNNAAFQVHASDFEDISPEHFEETIRTNLYGYFFMAQAAVKHMAPGSAIVNNGSVTGLRGSSQLIDYSMTKGGIHAFTRALSGNLLDRGIRVNCVAPGPVWSPLNPSDRDAESVAHFGQGSKMGRPAQPEELAPAFVFLASSHCSSYVTGEILPVVGGY